MAGCGYIFFQRSNCVLNITNSIFARNTASNGGAFYLTHTLGMVTFVNNTFTENSAKNNDLINSVGGVFSLKVSPESFLILINNSFVNNYASRGGVYLAISGYIKESNSHYISKFFVFIYGFLS